MKTVLIFLFFLFIDHGSYCQLNNSYTKLSIAERMNLDRALGKKFGNFSGKIFNSDLLITDKDLKHKVTLITFWFSSCSPCQKEFKDLISLYQKYILDSSFQLISITFDPSDEINKTLKIDSLPYTILQLPKYLCTTLDFASGYPSNFITDREGNIAYAGSGFEIHKYDNYFQTVIIPKINTLLSSLKKSN